VNSQNNSIHTLQALKKALAGSKILPKIQEYKEATKTGFAGGKNRFEQVRVGGYNPNISPADYGVSSKLALQNQYNTNNLIPCESGSCGTDYGIVNSSGFGQPDAKEITNEALNEASFFIEMGVIAAEDVMSSGGNMPPRPRPPPPPMRR
jgi:hypothetical protein